MTIEELLAAMPGDVEPYEEQTIDGSARRVKTSNGIKIDGIDYVVHFTFRDAGKLDRIYFLSGNVSKDAGKAVVDTFIQLRGKPAQLSEFGYGRVTLEQRSWQDPAGEFNVEVREERLSAQVTQYTVGVSLVFRKE